MKKYNCAYLLRYNKTNSNWHHWSLVTIVLPKLQNVTLGLRPRVTFPNFGTTTFTNDLGASHYLYNDRHPVLVVVVIVAVAHLLEQMCHLTDKTFDISSQ